MENSNQDDEDKAQKLALIDPFSLDPGTSFFDFLLENLGHIVDDMTLRSHLVTLGAAVTASKSRFKSIKTVGAYVSDEDLMCGSLFTAGAASFKKLVIAEGPVTISGAAKFKSYSLFKEETKISGAASFAKHIMSSGVLRFSGKVIVKANILSDNLVINSGVLKAESIKTRSDIIAKHTLEVHESIIARKFMFLRGGGAIGSIQAEQVSIGFKDLETYNQTIQAFRGSKNLLNPVGLARYVKNIIRDALLAQNFSKHSLEIEGDIVAEDIFLSNCIVHGNVIGNNIIIGPNVQLLGKLLPSVSLRVAIIPDGKKIKTKKEILRLQYQETNAEEYLSSAQVSAPQLEGQTDN